MHRKPLVKTTVFLLFGMGALVALYLGVLKWDAAYGSRLVEAEPQVSNAGPPLVALCKERNAIRVTEAGLKTIGLQTLDVKPAPPPEPLRLPGSLMLDPDRMVRVHARFPGELVSLGTVKVPQSADGQVPAEERPLRFGDTVVKDQLLAVVWSKDIGEKKSELVGALTQAKIDQTLLSKLENVPKGIVPQPRLQEARGNYEADLVAIAKAERTLRSWKLTDREIADIHQEADRLEKRVANDPEADRSWAETEVRSPINGIIVEKNFNVHDMIDPSQDLFKIADLGRIQVLVNAY